VSCAPAHGAEYGADPETLILFGFSGGKAASITGLREATPLPECAVEIAPFVADGMVLWEGNRLLSEADRNPICGESVPMLLEAFSLLAWLATGPKMPVDLVTTPSCRASAKRCDPGLSDPDTVYWSRALAGSFRLWERFEAIGAMDNGCIDMGEVGRVLGAIMQEAGFDAEVIFLEHGQHGDLSEDQALVVTEILTIADR